MSASIEINLVLPISTADSNLQTLEYIEKMVKLFRAIFEAGLPVQMKVNVRWEHRS